MNRGTPMFVTAPPRDSVGAPTVSAAGAARRVSIGLKLRAAMERETRSG